MGLKDSDFLVGMVSANKANGQLHRKAYAENLLAFAMFRAKHPDAYLYIHADPTKMFGGFDLINLMKRMGIPEDSVLFPEREKMRFGYSDQEMAALYTGMDVLLHVSYGEGFGVPAIEAQACGTRVIGSSWAATPDLLSDHSWLVEGQPFWDEAQNAFFRIPLIPSILNALELSYKADREKSSASIEFAKEFHIDKVWNNYWLPFLKEKLK
jgi:glycosyltransferase involved in cell wall biosynthesis